VRKESEREILVKKRGKKRSRGGETFLGVMKRIFTIAEKFQRVKKG
jgi:hypothetical protein